LEQAMAGQQAVHFLGIPEGDQALAQVALYLAIAPKSDAAYRALNQAKETVEKTTAEPVPMQLRNAPTRAMKEWGYSQGYQHAHQFEDALNTMSCLPDSLRGTIFYEPIDRGLEQKIAQRLAEIRARRSAGTESDPEK
ncbi:MAG: replication-associated recombination protein A, partial [Acidobacteriia bacterium]|nr:replication-associated recombination protein A [Terriglobia bacterium]